MNINLEIELYDSKNSGEKSIWISSDGGNVLEEDIDDTKEIGNIIQHFIETYHPEFM